MSHPCWWVQVAMLRIPYIPWWKTLLPCSRRTVFSHILCESLNEPESLCLTHWHAAAFWLPQAQQETAGWWATPFTIPRLCLSNYMPSAISPNFQLLRQQKTRSPAQRSQDSPQESFVMQLRNCGDAWLPC